jgi:hypothetical protein
MQPIAGVVSGEVAQPLAAGRLPEIVEREVERQIAIGGRGLQHRLRPRDVGGERRHGGPEAALGAEIGGGVEQPSRPGRPRR